MLPNTLVSSGLKGRTVLLVDDELFFLESLREGLLATEPETRVFLAEDGVAALEMLRCHDVDVVVSDIRMPNLNGVQLLSKIMRLGYSMPVILLSAYRDVAESERAAKLGASAILDKPVDYDDLLSAIEHALRPEQQASTRGFSISAVIQLLRAEKKTAVLIVKSEQGVGRIFVSLGEVVDAWYGDESRDEYGDDAMHRLLEFSDPSIELAPMPRQVKKNVGVRLRADERDTVLPSSPFAVDDYIQLACMGRHSVRIDVESDDACGTIFISVGKLWSAECEDHSGYPALRELMFMSDVRVTCRRAEQVPTVQNLPDMPWEQLLLGVAKNHDEKESAMSTSDSGEFDFSNIFEAPAAEMPAPEDPPVAEPVASSPRPTTLPDFVRLIDEGAAALLAKDYQAALEAYEAAAKLRPDDAVATANVSRLREIISR